MKTKDSSLSTDNQKKRPLRYISLAIKLSVSASLLYMLLSKVGGKTILSNIRQLNPLIFCAAAGVYILSIYISSIRWGLLIPMATKTGRLFSMYMIGSFFNTCMPGIIGGDAVKAYYISRELKALHENPDNPSIQSTVVGMTSVFMDRYIGLMALLTIGMAALPFGFRYIEDTPLKWFIPLALSLFLLGSLAMFRLRIGKNFRFISGVYDYFNLYKSKKDDILKAYAYSIFIQFLSIFSVYILSIGLSMNISFLSFLVFVPIITLISVIPISISGIGLREGAFVFLLGHIGISPDMSVTLSILWFLSLVIASLWGLYEYIRYKGIVIK